MKKKKKESNKKNNGKSKQDIVIKRDRADEPTTLEKLMNCYWLDQLQSIFSYIGFALCILGIVANVDLFIYVSANQNTLGDAVAVKVAVISLLVAGVLASLSLVFSHVPEKRYGAIARKISLAIIFAILYFAKGVDFTFLI